MALYNNPYQYSFGVPGQMNQFQQQPVQMPTQPVQQPQQNNNGILWVSGEVGAKSYTSNIITVGNVSAGSVGTEFSSIDEAAQYIFDNKIPISENKLILVNFTFGYQYCMIVQKYYEGKWGAYILFGCNVPSISYHVKTDGEWK